MSISSYFFGSFAWDIFLSFYLEEISVLDVKMCFLDTAEEWVIFAFILIVMLCF